MSCKCAYSLNNTGVDCLPLMSQSEKLYIMPLFGVDGVTLNYIDVSTFPLTSNLFTTMVNEANAQDRLFPLPEHKNAKSERGESTYDSFDDDTKVFVKQGVRTNTIIIAGKAATPKLAGKLEALRCAEFGLYIGDSKRQLTGSSHGETGKLYPVKVDAQTWDVKYIFAESKTIARIEIKFDWAVDELDKDLITLTAEELPTNILRLEGLKDITSVVSSKSTTGFVLKLKTEFGDISDPILVKGLVKADFALYNVTDSAPVVITTADEVNGVYTFIYPAQTTGDVLRLTPTKNGYDFSAVVLATITTP